MSVMPARYIQEHKLSDRQVSRSKGLAILLEYYVRQIPALMDGGRRNISPESIKELKRAWR